MRKTMLYDVMQERGCFMAKTDTQVSLRVTSQFKARLERQADGAPQRLQPDPQGHGGISGAAGGNGKLRHLSFRSLYFHK